MKPLASRSGKPKQRHRSTNLEVLGSVPHATLRRLRETAAQADLPLARVFADVVAIGMSVVTDPTESPYATLIAFRSALIAKQKELENGQEPPAGQTGAPAPERKEPGQFPHSGTLPETDPEKLSSLGRTDSEPENFENGFNDALERSGLEPEAQENSGLFIPD